MTYVVIAMFSACIAIALTWYMYNLKFTKNTHVHNFGPWKVYGKIERFAKDGEPLVRGLAQTRKCMDDKCGYIEFDAQEF